MSGGCSSWMSGSVLSRILNSQTKPVNSVFLFFVFYLELFNLACAECVCGYGVKVEDEKQRHKGMVSALDND